MEDHGKFNDYGFYSDFRLVWESGLNAFAQPLEPKEVESYDWPEQNGTEYRLINRTVKPRQLPLGFLLMADDVTDFWLRFNALEDFLLSDGTFDLYINQTGRSYKVFYNKPSNAQALTLFDQGGKVCARFVLEFIEPNPRDRSDYNVFSGPSASIPATEADVLALVSSLYPPAGVTFNSGTTYRTFSIVKQSDKVLSSVIDLMADIFGDITDKFTKQSSITIGGIEYDIMTMVNAVPFSTNHNIKFLLS
jgi:hypothetical protein